MRVRQYAYFALISNTLTASEITGRLGIEPDAISVRGSQTLILRFLGTTHGGSPLMNRGCQSPTTWITSSTGSAPMQQRLVIWS